MLKPEPTIEAYRKFARLRIDAVNLALVGIPEEKVRYHLCWGSWHGPHTRDLPLEHIIDLILEAKAQTYSFEAGNVRHARIPTSVVSGTDGSRTLCWREMDSNFQYASTVRWHRAMDLPLPPTVKRRSAGERTFFIPLRSRKLGPG